jgi:hypothetical protein
MPEYKPNENKSSEFKKQGRKQFNMLSGSTTKSKFEGSCEELANCIFDCEDSKQSGSFEATMDLLANYVGAKYEHGGEIRNLIKNLAPIIIPEPADLPTVPAPTATQTKIWELKIAAYVKKEDKIADNVRKLYSLVWGQCTDYMKSKLETVSTFQNISDTQDALGLLKEIKGFTYKFENEKYPAQSLVEATDKLHRLFQGKEMTNSQFLEKFKSMVAVIEHYGGSVGMHPKIEQHEIASITKTPWDSSTTYADDIILAAEIAAKERVLACMFLNRADKTRYGDMVIELHNDYVKGKDSYPSTMRAAFTMLTNWRPKYESRPSAVQNGSSFNQEAGKNGNIHCWGCGKEGIVMSECTNELCIKKWKAKQDRRSNTTGAGQQHLNIGQNDVFEFKETNEIIESEYNGFSFHQGKRIGDTLILLDNQSTHSTFYEKDLVTNIREASHSMTMFTNGGSIVYHQIADLPGYGTVWFNSSGIANIVSLAEAESRGHTISYVQGCFKVINGSTGRVTEFKRTPEGLFAHKVTRKGIVLVQTVKENESLFTQRQVAMAKEAQCLYEMIGRPSTKDFIAIIKNNLLPNATVSAQDIVRCEAIYGKDLGALQGKTTRGRPQHVTTDYVNIPPDILLHHRKITLAADIMFVGGISFLITTSRNIQFTTVEKVECKKETVLVKGIMKVVNLYQRRGFIVNICLMDNEFEKMRAPLLEKGVALNICGPNEHVPEIERKIRTVKERVRGVITTLPFKSLPAILIVHAVIFSVMWLNFFPPSGGVSPTLSPQCIVTGLHVDCNKHCRIPFGAYAQVHAEPDPSNNAMVSRTVGGISLGPTGNIQGTYRFLSILSGKQIQARSFTPLPMPLDVIEKVESFAPSGNQEIEFGDRNGDADKSAWQEEEENDEEYFDTNEYMYEDENDISLHADSIDEEEVQDIENDGNVIDSKRLHPETVEETTVIEPEDQVSIDKEDGNSADFPIEIDQHEENLQNQGVLIQDPGVDSTQEPGVESTEDPNDAHMTSDRIHSVTRSGRQIKTPRDLFDSYSLHQTISPSTQTPSVCQTFGGEIGGKRNESPGHDAILHYAFTQYSLKQGLRKFPTAAKDATIAEMKQLHEMNVFQPVHRSSLTRQEIQQTLGSLIFIKEKRCGRIKARACADGRRQRFLYDKHEASSPTVKTESVILTSVIDAAEEREVAVYDIPGAFLHAELPDIVHMKVTGDLARLLIHVAPDVYARFKIMENEKDVIYLRLTRALYGCILSALQFWKHLSTNLLSNGYVLNKYDPCVANKEIDGSQMTIVWHVDDLKISHKKGEVIEKEVKWLETIYGPLVGSRGNHHTYLGMDLTFGPKKELTITMIPYLQEIIDEFPDDLGKSVSTPAANHLFEVAKDAVQLSPERAVIFHHTVAKVLWAALRARPDLLTALSFLTSRVKSPDEDDYKKLIRMLSYLKNTINLPLVLSADGSHVIKWWADASFAVRGDLKSQTGASMSLGKGGVYNMSRKQKSNTTSSTEAELVGADDVMPQMIWTRHFLLEQGVEVSQNILFQDNKSAILLETNGQASSSRRTRHINIRFFFIKDRISSKELELQYCPTDQMVGDFFTKPLQGSKFFFFRQIIMGEEVE